MPSEERRSSFTALYKPGQKVERSGVYNAIHQPRHRPAHHVVFREGQTFPLCRGCEHTVFLLVYCAPFAPEDPDFA